MRKITHFFFWLMLLSAFLTVPVFARSIPVAKDSHSTAQAFSEGYGWDHAKLQADTWEGTGGETYSRPYGHEYEFFCDLYDTALEMCRDLGVVSGGGSGSGANIIEVALNEVDMPDNAESPPGSDNVKYNTWYYGHEVSNPIGEDGSYVQQYMWCVVFLEWCGNECGYLDSGFFNKIANVRGFYNYHTQTNGFDSYSVQDCTQWGGSVYTIKPGDVLCYGDRHIGLVTSVGEDFVITTEGNTNCDVDNFTITKSYLQGSFAYCWNDGMVIDMQYPDDSGYQGVFYALERLGFNKAAAAGIVANMMSESGCNAQLEVMEADGTPSYGLCMWHGVRIERLHDFCDSNGMDWTTVSGQLSFLIWELENYSEFADLYTTLLNVTDTAEGAYEAAYAWCVDFERPADKYTKAVYRGNLAKDTYYPELADKGA